MCRAVSCRSSPTPSASSPNTSRKTPMPRNLFVAAVLCVLAGPIAAQSTGTPVFHAPYRIFDRYEFGANISDAGNLAVEGFYGFSRTRAKRAVPLRAGVKDNGNNVDASVLLGFDARYRMIDQSEDFPLDGALITGV